MGLAALAPIIYENSTVVLASARVNLHLRNDVRQIYIPYENSTVVLASVGLAQAHPNNVDLEGKKHMLTTKTYCTRKQK